MKARAKLFFGIWSCLIMISCTEWELKKIPAETYLAEKWKAIDLSQVETYPTFDFCDELASKESLKACFEDEVTRVFYTSLSQRNIVVSEQLSDTIRIGFIINERGTYCIDSLELSKEVKLEIPHLERWIHDACEELPKAYPATLRNIPVKTRFIIPLIFQTE